MVSGRPRIFYIIYLYYISYKFITMILHINIVFFICISLMKFSVFLMDSVLEHSVEILKFYVRDFSLSVFYEYVYDC